MSVSIPGCAVGTVGLCSEVYDDAAALMVDEHGIVQHCDEAVERLFGYLPHELTRRHISMLLPQLSDVSLLQDGRLDSRLRFLCRIGGYFHARARGGERVSIDVFLNDLGKRGSTRLRMIVRRDDRQ